MILKYIREITSVKGAWVALLASLGMFGFYYLLPMDVKWFLWPTVVLGIVAIAYLTVNSLWPFLVSVSRHSSEWFQKQLRLFKQKRRTQARLNARIANMDAEEKEFVQLYFRSDPPAGSRESKSEMEPRSYKAGCRLVDAGVVTKVESNKSIEFTLAQSSLGALAKLGFPKRSFRSSLLLDPKLILVDVKSGGGMRSQY